MAFNSCFQFSITFNRKFCQLLPVYTTSLLPKTILHLKHWLVSTILEYCTAAHSVEPRDVLYLYELFLSQEKFKKAIGLATTLHTTFDLHNLTWMCNTILLRNNGLNQNKNWQIK